MWRTVFPNLEVGWAFGFSGTQKSVRGIGSVAIVESLWRGQRTSLCCNWNPTSSSANTSCLERLVLIFTGHVLGTTSQSNTYFFLLPLIQRLMSSGQNQNSCFKFLVEGYSFFNPLYVGAGVPCCKFRLWHCTKSLYWLASPNIFWQSLVAILQYANEKKGNQSLAPMWYVPYHALQNSKTPLCIFYPSVRTRNRVVHFVGLM